MASAAATCAATRWLSHARKHVSIIRVQSIDFKSTAGSGVFSAL